MAAIANSFDCFRASSIAGRTLPNSHLTTRSRIPFPFFSAFLFLNFDSRGGVRADFSACSSPVLEDDPAVDSAPVLELSLKLQDFDQNADHFPDDSAQLNALICSLFSDPETQDLAYKYYSKAKAKSCFTPDRYTLKLVVKYLMHSENWRLLVPLCEDFRVFKVLPGRAVCCRLISVCVKARKLKLVNDFLDVFLENDSETAALAFSCSMKCCNELHMYRTTVAYFQRMKSCSLDLDISTYHHIMKAYMKLGKFEKVIAMFEEFEARKMMQNKKVSIFCSRMYWMLCESLGKMGRVYEALEYFREMSNRGIPEGHLLYSSLIGSFASVGDLKMAEELLEEAEGKKMVKDPALFLKLTLRYVKEGLMEKTLDVVAVMKRVNIRVSDCIFCAIVNGFSKKRGFRAAVKVYEDLVAQGSEPGQVTYASILNAYTRLGLYPKAETVFTEMEKKGYDKCVVAYSSMVAAYAKMGRPNDAAKLVAKMKARGCNPNVWTYNALLDMQGRAQNLRQVEKTWKEMKRRKVEPDRVSYTTVISSHNRAGEYEACVKYYEEFKATGEKIDRAMAGIMVAVLSKMNRVDDIVELLQDMKMQGMTRLDARFYRSAMNALRDAGLVVQAKWLQEQFKYS